MRAAGRCKEIAIRIAIGAGRVAVLRQLLTESLLLAIAGGVVGVFLGAVGLLALLGLAPAELPRLPAPGHLDLFALMDGRILAFAFGVSIIVDAGIRRQHFRRFCGQRKPAIGQDAVRTLYEILNFFLG